MRDGLDSNSADNFIKLVADGHCKPVERLYKLADGADYRRQILCLCFCEHMGE